MKVEVKRGRNTLEICRGDVSEPIAVSQSLAVDAQAGIVNGHDAIR
jgi:hypothetical protein